MSTRRFITLTSASLGAAALLLGSAMSGHAQVPPGTIVLPTCCLTSDGPLPVSDLLAFTGTATITNDNTSSALGIPCASTTPEGDAPGAVDLVGCGGSFSFTSAVCAGVSDPNPDLPAIGAPEAGACTVTAAGSFENLVCGTGFVQGTNVSETTGPDAGETGSFGIVFAATIGVVTGQIGDDYTVGVVQLGPPVPPGTPNPADPTDCTSAFTVSSVDVLFDL